MKKALLALTVVAMSASAFAQGTIDFINRGLLTTGGNPGGNGDGTYNVPIYVFQGRATRDGAGDLAGGVTLGLFAPGATTPMVTTLLRTEAGTGTIPNNAFFATSTQTATLPTAAGNAPGDTPTLTVRAWQGASFAAAQGGAGQWGEWSFVSQPLGGTPAVGTPIPTPGMTGWGPQDGSGLELVPEPSTLALGALGLGALLLRRRK
jgi:hypothetical protein